MFCIYLAHSIFLPKHIMFLEINIYSMKFLAAMFYQLQALISLFLFLLFFSKLLQNCNYFWLLAVLWISNVQNANLLFCTLQPLMLIVPDVQDVYTPLQTDLILPISEVCTHILHEWQIDSCCQFTRPSNICQKLQQN